MIGRFASQCNCTLVYDVSSGVRTGLVLVLDQIPQQHLTDERHTFARKNGRLLETSRAEVTLPLKLNKVKAV